MPKSLSDKLRKSMVSAINDFDLIQDGDKILVAVSGGKDSAIMILLLNEIRKKAKINFSIKGILINQNQPGFDPSCFLQWAEKKGLDIIMVDEDIHNIVLEKVASGKSLCSLCARFRRGVLYTYAHKHGYDKIALGHHRNDLNETILMNMFFSGRIASMPPKLVSNDKRNTVIRPMCYIDEDDLKELSNSLVIPTVPCNCGHQTDLQREMVKDLIDNLSKKVTGIKGSLLTAQKNLRPSQLSDVKYW